MVFLFLCCNKLHMDNNQPSNGDDLDDKALCFIFMCMMYRQIKDQQSTIRYNSILTGHDRMMEFINGDKERIFN